MALEVFSFLFYSRNSVFFSLSLFQAGKKFWLRKSLSAKWDWSLKLVQTCPNLSRLVQTCPNLFRLVQTCPDLFRLVQTCLKLFKLVLKLVMIWPYKRSKHWPNFSVMRSESFITQVRFSSLILNIKFWLSRYLNRDLNTSSKVLI